MECPVFSPTIYHPVQNIIRTEKTSLLAVASRTLKHNMGMFHAHSSAAPDLYSSGHGNIYEKFSSPTFKQERYALQPTAWPRVEAARLESIEYPVQNMMNVCNVVLLKLNYII